MIRQQLRQLKVIKYRSQLMGFKRLQTILSNYTYLSIYPSVYHTAFHTSAACLSICLYVLPSVCTFFHLSLLCSIFLCACLFVRLFVHLFLCFFSPFVCQSFFIHTSTYLSVHLSVSHYANAHACQSAFLLISFSHSPLLSKQSMHSLNHLLIGKSPNMCLNRLLWTKIQGLELTLSLEDFNRKCLKALFSTKWL
jgi:hypothetical protein